MLLFILLYLYEEKDKVNKIKNNKNNIVNDLDIKDLWLDVEMNKKEFKQELKSIKNLKIQFNQILKVYEILYDEDEKKEMDILIDEIEKRKKVFKIIESYPEQDTRNNNEGDDIDSIDLLKPDDDRE